MPEGKMDNHKPITKEMVEHAKVIFQAGIDAVDPAEAVRNCCHLDNNRLVVSDTPYELDSFENIYVIGAGKAAAPMAAEIETILGDAVSEGAISVKYGYTARLEKIRMLEGGHPVPDTNGLENARAIRNLAQRATQKDLVICLVSGGGSALLPLPANGITLEDKQRTIQVLLECGASIHEVNIIRKHISAIKGGRLAKEVYPAKLICILISDVVGDDPATIASGPTVPDSSTFSDCMSVIEDYDIARMLPAPVMEHLQRGMKDPGMETPEPGSHFFAATKTLICANNMAAIKAAAEKAGTLGYKTVILSSMIEGETRDVARVHTAVAREVMKTGNPVPKPACILSGGETTVTVKGKGTGGRNQEFCLAAIDDISGMKHIVILSAGTDGTDGPTDAAGAVIHGYTATIAAKKGISIRDHLARNDSYSFFKKAGGLLVTGPTNTNVMDLRIMLIR